MTNTNSLQLVISSPEKHRVPFVPGKNEELVKRYQETHDKSILDEIVKSNLGLVGATVSRVCKIPRHNSDYDDMFSDGAVGLINAVKGFDPDHGYAFSTFATQCISNALIQVLRKNNNRKTNAWKYALSTTESEHIINDDNSSMFDETDGENPITDILRGFSMTKNEKTVLTLMYGIGLPENELQGFRRKTYREVAEHIGDMTFQNVEQIHKKLMRRLRDHMNEIL